MCIHTEPCLINTVYSTYEFLKIFSFIGSVYWIRQLLPDRVRRKTVPDPPDCQIRRTGLQSLDDTMCTCIVVFFTCITLCTVNGSSVMQHCYK